MSSIFKGSPYRQPNDVEAGSSRSAHSDDEDHEFSAVPFDITSTKNAPIDPSAVGDNLADVGLHASLLLLRMPILAPVLGEERLLSIGLFFNCAHVPYAAAVFSLFYVFSQPCLRSIVSKQVGPCEQGKAQGFISGICSFANVYHCLTFNSDDIYFLAVGYSSPTQSFSVFFQGIFMDIIKRDDQTCAPLVNCRSSGLRVSTAAGSTCAMLSAGVFAMPIFSRDLQYLACFLRQFCASISKVDYFTYRHGFITAHFAEGSYFDFQKYI
ncbi:hypothetical protein CRYUN_Cryun26dG0098200 [Craigia yunnanensis]